MKKKFLLGLVLVPLLLSSCGGKKPTPTDPSTSPSITPSVQPSNPTVKPTVPPGPSEDEVKKYMNGLATTSQSGHFYYHYLRFAQTAKDFNKWDVWVWPYRPKENEGVRFDWVGRTTSADRMSATGDAKIDSFGYTSIDIDLNKTYKGGWDAKNKKMLDININYLPNGVIDDEVQMGFQIVESSTRTSASGFWNNDGGNVFVRLNDFALKNKDGTTSYHAFVYQEKAQKPTAIPVVNANTAEDPFDGDTGDNVTYGKAEYKTADFNDKPLAKTSEQFLKEAGVGYQIMVSSFNDSDGDGFGDIYGIYLKLDYLQKLGVKVLWLTPIQKSDSYHGYDITDYLTVDEKFGSASSPAAEKAGKKSEETAMSDYKLLLDEAHNRGMLVVMDLVLNHTSTSNNWFVNSAQLDKTMRAYYQWGNHDTQSAIKEDNFWYPYGDHVYSYYAKFGSSMPELNYAYAGTRAAVEAMAKNWCKIGVDGFRMDAVKHIFLKDEIDYDKNDTYIKDVSVNASTGKTQDYSSDLTKNLNFWKELNYVVKKDYPNAFFVGENFDGHAYHVAPFYEGFDSLFDFYSYFNFTSIASYFLNNGNTGEYLGAHAASFLGNWNDSATEKYDPNADDKLEGNKTKSIQAGEGWNLAGVFNTYNKYRSGSKPSGSYSMINGAFTSNHDIARTTNRVVGTEYDNTGLTAQGKVTSSNYDKANMYATLVQISELMLPGLTWIYYGDELGMTGNFLDGKKESDGYSDLAYRQPMKWVDNGQVGDGSGTTGYSITGSGTSVKWDEVNSSSKVASVEKQVKDSGSHYNTLASFATAKNADQALINGIYKPYYNDLTDADAQKSVVSFTRSLNGTSYRVVVNFGNSAVNLSTGGTLVAKYGTASNSNVASHSAALIKLDSIESKYSLLIGSQEVATTPNPTPGDPSFDEYMALGVSVKAGDQVQVKDSSTGTVWTIANLDKASYGFAINGGKLVCTESGTYDFYLKFQFNNDQIYIGKSN